MNTVSLGDLRQWCDLRQTCLCLNYTLLPHSGPSTGKAPATLNDEAFDEDLTVDADSDSSTASDQTDNSSENSTSFSDIAINDFIVVELKSEKERKIRFIGKVISIEPCRCRFLQASKKIPNGFIYPDATDEGDIEADEFIGTLEPLEILRRGTLVFPPKQVANGMVSPQVEIDEGSNTKVGYVKLNADDILWRLEKCITKLIKEIAKRKIKLFLIEDEKDDD
ncbi:hypothetical protein FQA39_LY06123 [Lamprigera yunnana]|nr:hypothetical protein FQA39_LY06123 [Lamprigera yunnana]